MILLIPFDRGRFLNRTAPRKKSKPGLTRRESTLPRYIATSVTVDVHRRPRGIILDPHLLLIPCISRTKRALIAPIAREHLVRDESFPSSRLESRYFRYPFQSAKYPLVNQRTLVFKDPTYSVAICPMNFTPPPRQTAMSIRARGAARERA